MEKLRLATLWFDGCSGCHMSLLDTDERLLELTAFLDIVYSPLVDVKEFPDKVDITCVEGAISSPEDERMLVRVRNSSRLLVALGDCAVTGNIPAMRNIEGAPAMLRSIYTSGNGLQPQIPALDLPALNDKALPLHRFVPVDLFIPGCPPGADTLFTALTALIHGNTGHIALPTCFGA
ncbi:MAG: NADP oxidoreductase [Desulfobulbus sp.]|nr:NADP oxidoreductase [Desulfobulbus sp.]